jgi:hypothetical protein
MLKPMKGKLGYISKIIKIIARWRHKSKISKRNIKTNISYIIAPLGMPWVSKEAV